MSLLRRTPQLAACVTLAAIGAFAQTQSPTNLFLLPNSSSTTPTVSAFRTDPFSIFSTFQAQPGASFIQLHPNGQKLYVGARSGADTLIVVDAVNTSNIQKRLNLGQGEAMAISPDGRRLVVVAGSAHIIDTTSDVVVAALSDVGNSPSDVAIALDGSRAFVLSPTSNRLTAIDLNTNQIAGSPVTVSGNASSVTVGPDGMVYVTATNVVQIIDGRSMTIVRDIQLNATPTRLSFTPDGQFALSTNRTPLTGSSILLFDIRDPKLASSIPNFNVIFDKILFVAGNRAYAFSNSNQSIVEVSINPFNVNPVSFSGIGDSDIRNITDIAISNELPNARFLFIAQAGTIRRIDMGSIPGTAAGQVAIPAQPGPLVFTSAQNTGTPTTVLAYNNAQTTTPGGTYRPLVARVTDSFGRPLFAVNVTFTSDNPSAQILGAQVTTNTQGYAITTVVAPSTSGTFNVTASAGPGPNAPSANYVLTTSAGSTGGTATGLLSIASGNGQIVPEQFLLTDPLSVRVRDSAGNPVANQTITFTLVTGNGTMASSTAQGISLPNTVCSGNSCTATTDAQGIASASFLATAVPPGFSFLPQTISASNGQATVNFVVTTLLSALPGGGQAAQPVVERIKPTDGLIVAQAGTTLNEAVVVKVIAASGIQAGQAIPNIALRVRAENSDPLLGPTATCAGEGEAPLTDAQGVATCNLRVGGRLGRTTLTANIGSALTLGGATINLEVRPGPPSVLRLVQGNNQSGNPGQRLSLAFVAEVQDAFGNVLPAQAVNWEVATPNSITLANIVSVSDSNGRVSALGTLGSIAGTNQVRVRIGNVVTTFNFTTNLTISALNKVSGDGQTAIINQPFPQSLVVEVRDERGGAVPNQSVAWVVASGSATVSNSAVTTDSSGRSSVTVRAGGTAGPVEVRATLGGRTQSFNLTVRPPGPVVSAAGIVTTARNQAGIVPCGLATVFGSNLAPGINGIVNLNFLGVGALPTSYNGLEIIIAGVASPIVAVANQNGQESVIIQVPCEVAAPGTTSVTIRIPGATGQVDGVQVFRAAPGIFETPASGSQRAYAAVIRSDGSYVTPANPALRGEVVYAAMTGLGLVNPATGTNRTGTGGQLVNAGLVVGVNDQGVRIVSASYAISMVGVYWVGFEVPADSAPGLFRSFSVAAEAPNGSLVFSNGSTIAAIQ